MDGYVSTKQSLGYRFLPKVACTSIKYALFQLDVGRPLDKKKEGDIHRVVKKGWLGPIDECERRIIVIRDPIKRFLSGYRNRVTFHRAISRKNIQQRAPYLLDEIPFFDPTLEQFADSFEAYRKLRTINHHLKPVYNFLDGHDLSYFTDVYTMEELPKLEADLSELFSKKVVLPHMQTGGKKVVLEDLSQMHMEKLLNYYEKDYELMADYYSKEAIVDQWRSAKKTVVVSQSISKEVEKGSSIFNNNNKALPKVSVLMPVYNAEKFVARAIDSILAQSFRDFEFIIINDGSTDSTAQVIRSYRDSRIKHITLEENIGVVEALNMGLTMARGEYIARMDADDYSMPSRFMHQVRFLDENKDYIACGSSIIVSAPSGAKCRVNYLAKHSEIITALSFGYKNIAHPSVMLRLGVIKEHGLNYLSQFKYAEDYMLWNQLANYGKLYNIRKPLLKYSRHPDQISVRFSGHQASSARQVLSFVLSGFFQSKYCNLPQQSYINFLIRQSGNGFSILSPKESRIIYRDFLGYVQDVRKLDFHLAKKILTAKYLFACFYYNYSFKDKIKSFGYCLISKPLVTLSVVIEEFKYHFTIRKQI